MITGFRPTRSDSQPATSGPGTLAASSTPYMSADRRRRRARRPGQVQRHEDVQDAEAARAAAEDGRGVDATGGRGRRGRVRYRCADGVSAAVLSASRRRRLADGDQDRDGDDDRDRAQREHRAPPPDEADRQRRREADEHGADVAAGDVDGDRRPDAASAGTARRGARCRRGAGATRRSSRRC